MASYDVASNICQEVKGVVTTVGYFLKAYYVRRVDVDTL